MSRVLTPKRKKFADKYIETGNGTHAALEAFDVTNENSAAAAASRALRSVKVREYLASRSERAAIRVVELSEQDDNRPVALSASKDILDRAGFNVVEKTLNLNVEIESDGVVKQLTEQLNELYRGTGFEGDGRSASLVGIEAQDQERSGDAAGLQQA